MKMIRFSGASEKWTDGTREYVERGPILINPKLVAGAYDNTILIAGNQIRVMEKLEEIETKLAGGTNENKAGRRGLYPGEGTRKRRRARPEGKARSVSPGREVGHDRHRDACRAARGDCRVAGK